MKKTLTDNLKSPQRGIIPLHDNIKCGNSIIDWNVMTLGVSPEEIKLINPFDWNRGFPNIINDGGFDVVIGNPHTSILMIRGDVMIVACKQ